MKNSIKLYVLSFVVSLFSACSDTYVEQTEQTEQDNYLVNFTNTTKSTEGDEFEDATLSFALFPMTDGLEECTNYGIYKNAANSDGFLNYITPLTPAALSYIMNIASTGEDISTGSDFNVILPTQIESYESCYGYKIYRTEDEDNPNLYLSSGISVDIDGMLIDNEYSMSLSDYPLSKKVGRIKFKIKSFNEITESDSYYQVNSIKVNNLLKVIDYCPQHEYHYNSEPEIEETDVVLKSNDSETFSVYSTDPTPLYAGDNDYVEIIAGDYTSLTTSGTTLYPTPNLIIDLDGIGEITVPIKTNIEAQTVYTYTLTIATTSINVVITAATWGTTSDDDNYIEDTGSITNIDEFTISITQDSDWDNVGNGDDIETTI